MENNNDKRKDEFLEEFDIYLEENNLYIHPNQRKAIIFEQSKSFRKNEQSRSERK